MKLNAIVVASVLCMAGAAQAQMAGFSTAGRAYGEVGYTGMKISGAGADVQPGALRGIFGYNFHPNFAVEGMLGFGVTKDSQDVRVGNTRVSVQGDVQHMYGIYLTPKAMLGPAFEVYGRLGWADTRLKTNASTGFFQGSDTNSGSDWSYGVGGNWLFAPRTYVGLDWMQYYDKNSTKIEGVTLALGYRF
jgi:hypothetical protein